MKSPTKSAAKSAKAPKPGKKAPVTPIKGHSPQAHVGMHPPIQAARPTMSPEDQIAHNAIREAANIRGARSVAGEFLIGKRVNGGLQDVYTIVLQPVQAPDGGTNMRIQFVPFVPPFFVRDESRPEIGDRHLIEVYTVPDEIADHYLEKQKMAAISKAELTAAGDQGAPANPEG